MKTKITLAVGFFCFFCQFVLAQNEIDALRYSQTAIGGTARNLSMGGAFGALGGDFSTLSQNPAGIALYKKSEWTFSPSFFNQQTTSSYLGNSTSDDKYNFNFSNAGIIGSYNLRRGQDSEYGWKNCNFGFGYNRMNNFHNRNLFSGVNTQNSLLDYFVEQANGINPGSLTDAFPFDAGLAYQTYLINPDTIDTTQYTHVIPSAGELQEKASTTTGSMGEVVFSFGANYSNRLYLGATIGYATLRYKEETTYSEEDAQGTINGFRSFDYNQDLLTKGSGVNFKLGMIFRATDWFRFGMAVHTPTFYNLTDEYTNTMNSDLDNGITYSYSSPNGIFEYDLITPFKAIGSVAFIIGERGLISADYEWLDYSEASLRSSSYKFIDENSVIRNTYAAANNIRVGTEWRFLNYAFRGGYSYYGDPFKDGMNPGVEAIRSNYTLGLGIRDKGYFIDFAYIFSQGQEFYVPYLLTNKVVEGTENDISSHNVVITVGFRY